MAGGSNNIARMSPRQRMINLMYIVLTAMLALNVSSDVLNGFSQVHEGLRRTNNNLSIKNKVQYQYLADLYTMYPDKAGPWYRQGVAIHTATDSLSRVMEQLKVLIARQADGPQGDYTKLVNLDDLEASSAVLLDPLTNRGAALRKGIEQYRSLVLPFITDSTKRRAIADVLSTAAQTLPGTITAQPWEQQMFESKPAIAAITLLTKLQGDLLHAENEALTNVISSVDFGDVKVNRMEAFVVPEANMIMSGGRYKARIVLAAIDTARQPAIYVGGTRLNSNGLYEFTATALGTHTYSGYIDVPHPDGSTSRHNFQSSYTVIEPGVTISPTMMNVLYAGINNPISISAPGIPMTDINASMTNGTLTRNGNQWVARVSAIGQTATINVSATLNGASRQLGSMTFRIRKLPDPNPYLLIGQNQYKGTPRRISKASLMGCSGVKAALDDGVLDIQYTVVAFKTIFFDSMGNAIPESSAGASFSERQREQFRRLKPGARFFISEIKAKGPDGITRDISPMEVALN